jgi:hypothetical protein
MPKEAKVACFAGPIPFIFALQIKKPSKKAWSW